MFYIFDFYRNLQLKKIMKYISFYEIFSEVFEFQNS